MCQGLNGHAHATATNAGRPHLRNSALIAQQDMELRSQVVASDGLWQRCVMRASCPPEIPAEVSSRRVLAWKRVVNACAQQVDCFQVLTAPSISQ